MSELTKALERLALTLDTASIEAIKAQRELPRTDGTGDYRVSGITFSVLGMIADDAAKGSRIAMDMAREHSEKEEQV